MTLSNKEREELRQAVANIATENDVSQSWVKEQINNALDHLETCYDTDITPGATTVQATMKAHLGAVIEDAAPTVFTNQHKLWIGAYWMRRKSQKVLGE